MTTLRTLLSLAALTALTALGPAAASAQPAQAPADTGHAQKKAQLGTLAWVKHGMLLHVPGKARVQPVTPSQDNVSLYNGYGLHTGVGEKAEIIFTDNSVMTMQESTDLVLCAGNPACTKKGLFHLNIGTVAVSSAPGSQPKFETARGSSQGQDTEFLASVNAGSTTFAVLHGVMFVTNSAGTERLTTGQQTVVTSARSLPPAHSANVQAEFAWTDEIPQPALGYDVSLAAEGGGVSGFSSQRSGDEWSADNINDGQLKRGWESGEGQVNDQSVTLDLPGSNLFAISSIVLDPGATGTSPDPSMDLKDFQIKVSSTGTDGPFTTVLSGSCRQSHTLQAFALPTPVLGNAVQLVARNNFGSRTAIAVAEMEVVANVAGFAYPSGMAIGANGDMYVADSANDRIQVLAPNGDQLNAWGSKGTDPGQFRQPEGLALDRQGNVWVADAHNNRIQEFASDGTFLIQFGTLGSAPGQFDRPYGIALDAAGNVYVADSRNHRIQKLSPQGEPLAQWGTLGSGPRQFRYPLGVAIGGIGNVFVADTGNNRIQKLSPTGSFLAQWGGPSFNGVKFNGPTDVVLDRQGNMYIADFGNYHVHELTPAGAHLATGPRRTAGLDQYLPQSLALDAHGVLYATDRLNSRIVQLDRGLQVQRLYGVFGALSTVLASPLGIGVGPSGDVFVSDPRKSLIEERSAGGDLVGTFGFHRHVGSIYSAKRGEFYYPEGLAVGPGGELFVEDAHTVQKVAPGGTVQTLDKVQAAEWVAVDRAGALYAVHPTSGRLQKVPAGGTVPTLLGAAHITSPRGIAVDAAGKVYVADAASERVIELSPGGAVLGSLGASAGLRDPQGVAVDAAGNVYVADGTANDVVELSPSGAVVARYGATAGIEDPRGLAVDASGNLYVASFGTDQIITLPANGGAPTVWN